jgi:iron complex transport system substrate-binding protein
VVTLKLLPASILAGMIAAALAGCHNQRIDTLAGTRRIVSLAPSITETLFALGAGSEVVGVSQYCDYPPQVLRLPKVGSFLTPNLEQIMALRPTLVIGLLTSSDLREIRALDTAGIATVMVDDSSIDAIESSIQTIAGRIARQQRAEQLLAQIRADIAETEERLSDTRRFRVLMVVGHQPLVAVGTGTYLDQLLALAHAQNIADRVPQSWPRLSLEYVIASRPEVILDGQMGTDPREPSRFWTRYWSIPAVHDGHVHGYPDDPTLHPGPRVALTLDLLARLIHPEAFAPPQSGRRELEPQALTGRR